MKCRGKGLVSTTRVASHGCRGIFRGFYVFAHGTRCLKTRQLSIQPTPLALSLQARMAANRAFLAGVGLLPSAMTSGLVPPLAPDDPLTLMAARNLAHKAALATAEQQVGGIGMSGLG